MHAETDTEDGMRKIESFYEVEETMMKEEFLLIECDK